MENFQDRGVWIRIRIRSISDRIRNPGLHKRWNRRVIKEGRFAPKRKADGHVMYIWRQSLRRIFKLLFTLHGISIKMQYPISICNKWVEIVFPVMTQRILDKPFYSWEDWGDQAEF